MCGIVFFFRVVVMGKKVCRQFLSVFLRVFVERQVRISVSVMNKTITPVKMLIINSSCRFFVSKYCYVHKNDGAY